MIYPEKAYTRAAQKLARATTKQATKTRTKIIDLMIKTEQPNDRPRARELVDAPPPGVSPRVFPHPPFFSDCEADPCNQTETQKCSHKQIIF